MPLHLHSGASGATSPSNVALLIENSDSIYLCILTPDNKTGGVIFGRASDNDAWAITAQHATGTLYFGLGLSSSMLTMTTALTNFNNGNLDCDFRVNGDNLGEGVFWDSGLVRLGINAMTPGATLHIYSGASGATPAAGTVTVIEHSSAAYLSILVPNASYCGILLGDAGSADICRIVRTDNDAMLLWANGTRILDIGAFSGGAGVWFNYLTADLDFAFSGDTGEIGRFDGGTDSFRFMDNKTLYLGTDSDGYLKFDSVSGKHLIKLLLPDSAGAASGELYIDNSNFVKVK